jgi:hypothetical protein
MEQRLLWAPGVVEVMEDEGQMGLVGVVVALVEVGEVEEVEVGVAGAVEVVQEGHHLAERNHCQLIPSSRKIHQTDYV